MRFQDPKAPLSTCKEKDCANCDVMTISLPPQTTAERVISAK